MLDLNSLFGGGEEQKILSEYGCHLGSLFTTFYKSSIAFLSLPAFVLVLSRTLPMVNERAHLDGFKQRLFRGLLPLWALVLSYCLQRNVKLAVFLV